jgi:hypothetical protein
VRVRCYLKLNAPAIRPAEGDLTQRGNDPFAEDEPDCLGGLREMTVRRRCRAEKGGVQQHARRGARDSRAAGNKDNDGCRSERTAPIEG